MSALQIMGLVKSIAFIPVGDNEAHRETYQLIETYLNTLATENEALTRRVAELEAFVRDVANNDPEYAIDMKYTILAAQDMVNVTAPADDSVFAPIANGDVCVFCYHSFDDPCENHPTCQDTGNPYAPTDDTEPVEVVKPLDSEPVVCGACSGSGEVDYLVQETQEYDYTICPRCKGEGEYYLPTTESAPDA